MKRLLVVAITLLSIANAKAAAESQPSAPVTVAAVEASSQEASVDSALLRITVVDSTAAANQNMSVSDQLVTRAMIDEAKNFGALEKKDLAEYFLKSGSVAFWNFANTTHTIKSAQVFNQKIVEALRSTVPGISVKFSDDFPALFSSSGLKLEIPRNKIMTSPLAITATIPRSRGGKNVVDINFSAPDNGVLSQLISRAKEVGSLGKNAQINSIAIPNTPPSATAPVFTYYIRLPASQVKKFTDTINPHHVSGAVTVVANPDDVWHIHPAQSPNPSATLSYKIPDTTSKQLQQIFKRDAINKDKRQPVLIVLDDAYPSQQAWIDSKLFFTDASAAIRSAVGLDPGWDGALTFKNGDLDEPKNIAAPTGIAACAAGLTSASCKFHAKEIEESLLDFRALAPLGHEPVRVVWLPLMNTQSGTFSQYAKIYRIVEATPGNIQTGKTNGRDYSKAAFETLNENLANIFGIMPRSYPALQNDWPTPGPILTNLVTFAQWYSAATGASVFISFSWTFSSKIQGERPGSCVYKTVLVVAAGNPCDIQHTCSGYTEESSAIGNYEFLQTFTNDPQRYIVVANVDSTGHVTCDSARPKPQAGLFAFSGNIQGDCGTSFSTPRVAWLLAARDAYRNTLTSDFALSHWFRDFYAYLFNKRDMSLCKSPEDLSCAVLQMDSLFSDVSF